MRTIYDIAKELKVAPSTVSKALNGGSGVSEKMRKRIVEYAKEVRYFPNSIAAKLKAKKSYSIGIIYSEELNVGLEHNFFSSIIQNFKNYVESKGYEITFVINNLGNQEMSYLEFCIKKSLEGVFIVSCNLKDKYLEELINSHIHCVTTDLYQDSICTVISDNIDGSKQAVDYFVSKGHKRIAHITGPIDSLSGIERIEGFIKAMRDNNLSVEDEFIIESKSFSFEEGYAAAKKFLEKDNFPNAAFCASDLIAMGFIKCLRDNGLNVPSDVSVIGFDDISFSKYFEPSLSTLKQDKAALGEIAAKKLLDLIDENSEDNTRITKVPVEFVKRDSTL